MDLLVRTSLLVCVAFIVGKLALWIVGYIRMCRLLKKLPQKPSHWLFGHAQEIKNSMDYVKYATDMMQSGAKVYCVWAGPFPVLGVTHPDTVKQLISQEHRKAFGMMGGYRFMKAWLGDGLLLSSGKKWERNRRLLTPAFHFGILSGYVNTMNQTADIFLDNIACYSTGGKSFNIFPVVCRATLDTMLRCSLSYHGDLQENEENEYVRDVNRMSDIMWKRLTSPLLSIDIIYSLSSLGREERQLLKRVHQFTGSIIKARRNELKAGGKPRAQPDFLDILLTATDEQGQCLSEQEIQDEVDTFTFEGHDTTASGISWAIYYLAKYPEFQRKVYDDVIEVLGDKSDVTVEDIGRFKYLPLFLKESLRYSSPVPLTSRQHVSKSIVIDGYEIPPGPRVDLGHVVIHKNPEIWKKPEVFDPERFSAEHRDDQDVYGFIPFSAGSRNCIGQVFANNEMKIVMAKTVRRFTILLDPDHTPEPLPDVVMRSTNGIRVIFQER